MANRITIIGLTGSYAMGKTTAAGIFRVRGIPVHDADQAVHQLLGPGGGAVATVAQHFPQTLMADNNSIDRRKLGDAVFADDNKRQLLESLLHPLVQEARSRWLQAFPPASDSPPRQLAVFDIPLLFETGKEAMCDYVVVVSAPDWVQQKRATARGLDEARLAAILARQLADSEKRKRADYIIPTQFGITTSTWYIDRLLADIRLIT